MKLFQFGPKRGGDLTNGIEAQSVPEPVTDLLSGQGATTESKRMHADAAFFYPLAMTLLKVALHCFQMR